MTPPSSKLSTEERERLLDAMQDRLAAKARSRPSEIVPRARGVVAPASYAQQRMWFLERFEPGSAAYNIPFAARLRGRLDIGALRGAFADVVARHEALRTTLRMDADSLVQRVGNGADMGLRVAAPGTAADLDGWVAAESIRPFDLERGPLLRCTLLAEETKGTEDAGSSEPQVLVVVAHHSVFDGWSMSLLLKELDACYRMRTTGTAPQLPQLACQYSDFAIWQQGRKMPGLEYWRERLAGAPPVLQLPTDDLPRRAEKGGTVVSATLPPELATGVRRIAAAEDATTFMVLLTAFNAVLGRLAGVEDVVVGAPVAGRPRPELQALMGYFLNTVAIRTDLSGRPTFRELLRRVRTVTTEAYDHQDVPFEQVVDAVTAERSTDHTPVYQVMVNHTTTVPLPRRLGGLDLEFLESGGPPAKLPLTLYIRDEGTATVLDLAYRTSMFSEHRITTLLDQLLGILEQATAEPDRPLVELSLVRPADAAVLPDQAATQAAQEQPALGELISHWARSSPDAPALEWQGRSLTYATLWQRAGQIREALGAPGNTVVAVTGARTPGLVTALLAVLTGGGVLLTLDPRLPRVRRQLMLRQARASHLVVVGADDPDLDTDGLRLLRVDARTALPVGLATGVPVPTEPLDARASYVFFTSGTTGVPKAVLGRAAGLTHFLCWQRDTFGVGPEDRCAQLTGLSFDVVLRDVLLPLVSGATLCLPSGEDDLLPHRCLAWLARKRITTVHTVPTLAQTWLAGAGERLALRRTFFAGEPLTGELVDAWRAATGSSTVVNLYGPTETTLAKCAHVVPDNPAPGVQPIGSPLPGGQALVLGPGGRACGIGEIGEIVLRTPYRSLGYLNLPDAPAFSANPATGEADDILYATGDLGRRRPDGLLDILGRADRQVKIRGVRVETDEVAQALTRHPAVAQAVVTVAEAHGGGHELAAYVVPTAGCAPASEAQLRDFLTERLPAAAVPTVVAAVERIPLTANGKTDWRALPTVVGQRETQQSCTVALTETEREVARHFGELLGLEGVGADDDFFRLGGHSLLAMRLASRLTQTFGVTVPLQRIFETPTATGIAAAVTEAAPPSATGQVIERQRSL